jgi:hypothetical protein
MPLRLIPDDIIEHYELREKAIDGYVYMEIRKGMCGLPQAGILANKVLKLRLACQGYFEQPRTPGLWSSLDIAGTQGGLRTGSFMSLVYFVMVSLVTG